TGAGSSAVAAAPALPSPGEVLDGRYRLLEKLGEGGMGAVFKAEHVRMGKVVALKLMRPEGVRDSETVKRFHQEARIVSRLSHPNTVSVFDFGELEDRSLYMAMEYVPGRDLAHVLRVEGALSERRALPIVSQVLRSLAEAHDAGIVHRDIKPGNVMVLRTREGEDFAKVVDFGIAKVAQAPRGQERNSGTGDLAAEFIGTPNYMSPEQIKGGALDGRSDLYSVGAMLFELLTGRPPFEAPSPMQVAARHLQDPPPALSDAAPGSAFTPALEALLQKALAKRPADRFQTADEMREALEAARDPGARSGTTGKLPMFEALDTTGGLQIMRRDDWDQFERALRRRQRLLPIAALLTVAALGAGGWRFYLEDALRPAARAVVTEEVEPNDGPNLANLIAPGTVVTGRHVRGEGGATDYDFFEFEVPGTAPVSARAEVGGVGGVDVAVVAHGPVSDDGKVPPVFQPDDLSV
ncbi:MAG: protein kinase domain-containing protein, partial [Myxococcales bacterium]